MRKFLLVLTVVVGAAAAVGTANAAPAAVPLLDPAPVLGPALVQPAQYYPDWREHEWRRREAYERFRRHEARREWRYRHGEYGYERPYGQRYSNGW